MKDLTGYKLVFSDDFDCDSVGDAWSTRREGLKGAGYMDDGQISFRDSCLHIKGEYRDGKFGPAWYCGWLGLRQRYTKGYFECRCKPGHAYPGLWTAFWIQAQHPYEPEISKGGPGGAELDVFECYTGDDGVEYFESTIHCAGKQQRIRPSKPLDSLIFLRCVPDNLCSEFHTFGFDWDDEAYTVYMDGVKLSSTSWGDGTSNASGEVIFSVEVRKPAYLIEDKNTSIDIAVDWVKIWQKE